MNIHEALVKVVARENLTRDEMEDVMRDIMSGNCTDAQIGGFLVALRMKGETIDEITAAAAIMREKATPVPAPPGVIDLVGTGGDGHGTFNISTASAIVAASAGALVAKHGNRSVSSTSGSAQVLAELGVRIEADPAIVTRCIEEARIGFLFAPRLHDAMKYAIGPRKELKLRTIFNVLGPLTNPAGAKRIIMGVFSESLVEPMAHVLIQLGMERAMVVFGNDGMDEISLTAPTTIADVADGRITLRTFHPESVGIERSTMSALTVSSPEESAQRVRGILAGDKGPSRDIVLLNAGAALLVAGVVATHQDGIGKAAEAIDSGAANVTLSKLVSISNT